MTASETPSTAGLLLDPLNIFVVAGEPSGDVLGARLMSSLKQVFRDCEIKFTGVGGPLMQEQGLISLFQMDELTVMGIAEVIPQLPNLLKRIKQTAMAAKELKPDAFITIDAPDFSFRVAAKLKLEHFPKIHYVAPSVWAWRPSRAKKLADLYDRVLTLLPFEPPYFEKEGMTANFVGHSIIESGAADGDGAAFREKYGINLDAPLAMVLPGSRRSEVNRHLAIFEKTINQVAQKIPNLRVVIPVVGKSAELVKIGISHWAGEPILIKDQTDKYNAMAASNIALAASGTVGLELALAKLPAIIAYRMHPVTAFLAKCLVKLEYVNLVNILEKKSIVPEYLLGNCTSKNLEPAVIELLKNPESRNKQLVGYAAAMKQLGGVEDGPGHRAAMAIKEEIEKFT